MPAALPFIMAGASALGAGVGVAGAVKQEQSRQAADNQAGRDAAKRADMERAAKDKIAADEALAQSTTARDEAKRRLVGGAKGRAGTLLTGPLGVVAPPSAAPKTLLGG